MQINVIDVGSVNTHSAKNGRQYQSLEVTYKNEQGQAQSKKLMSFAAPEVFKAAQEWQKGDSVNVATKKDDNGYWQWTKILADGEVDTQETSGSGVKPQATRVSGSNYPTQDERAQTQAYIIKQSSLSNAVSTLAISGKPVTANDVISLSKMYEGYVLGVNQTETIDDIASDIPF